jgi:hypothetical protein
MGGAFEAHGLPGPGQSVLLRDGASGSEFQLNDAEAGIDVVE